MQLYGKSRWQEWLARYLLQVVFIIGEVSDGGMNGINIEAIARDTIREIGYSDYRFGFDADTVAVITSIHGQSPDIAQGVSKALEVRGSKKQELGAGDQGMVFGYASDETDELMPLPIYLAHALTKRLAYVRKNGIVPYLGPDGKAQVSVEYEDNKPVRVDTVVISTQHLPEAAHDTIEKDMLEHVIQAVIPKELIDGHTKYLINPTGRFVIGGPQGDTGLTGRKIVVDTHMVDSPDMAAEHFRGKIRQRLTEASLMRPGMWLKILLLPESLISAKFRLPMRLALHSLFLSP